MSGIEVRGTRIAAQRIERIAERLARDVRGEAPPDVAVSREGGDVVLTGRALRARSLADPRLRGFAMLAGRGR